MRKARSQMTVRIVPLNSHQAGDARVSGTAAERVALIAELSRMLWARTGRPLPQYTRSTMPIAFTRLDARPDGD
jgi:hypothetical protein